MWVVATAGVMLFKGGAGACPRMEQSEPRCAMCLGGVGAAYTRWCIHKVVHIQGGR